MKKAQSKKQNRYTTNFSISLPPELFKALEQRAAEERRTRSAIITIAVEKYLGIYEQNTKKMIDIAKEQK